MQPLEEIIKERMAVKRVNTAQIAAAIGVSERMVQLYIRGERTPSYKALKRLSEYLDFGGNLYEQKIPPNVANEKESEYRKITTLPDQLAELTENQIALTARANVTFSTLAGVLAELRGTSVSLELSRLYTAEALEAGRLFDEQKKKLG
jgi:transcriptional regulator with XRE-family HTH domain